MDVKKEDVCFVILLIIEICTSYLFLQNDVTGGNHALTSAPLDDSWIHYVYAKNFADYGKFYYNFGQLEAGSTSPLWVVLLSIPLKLGFDPVISSKILGIIIDFLLVIFLFKFVQEKTSNYYLSFAVSSLLVIFPYFIYFRISGMEVSLFAFLSLISVYFFFKEKYKLTGLMLGLSILSRPEGYVLLVVLTLLSVFEFKEDKWVLSVKKSVIKMVLLSIIVSLPWNVFCLLVTGRPLPNTFYVKSRGSLSINGAITSFKRIIGTFHMGNSFPLFNASVLFNLVLFIFTLSLLYYNLRKKNVADIKLLLLPLIITFLMGLVVDYNFLGRYFLPVVPLFFLPLALLFNIENKILRITCLAFLALLGFNYVMNFNYFSDLYAVSCMNIYDIQESMGLFIKNNIPENATISTPDAGAIKYLTNHYVYDVVGLNTHEPFNFTEVDYRIDWPAYGNPYKNISEEVYTVRTNPNIVCAEDTLTLYKLNWE